MRTKARTEEEAAECRERIRKYACDYLRLSQRQFCIRAGLSEQWIKTWRGNFDRKTRAAIEATYPELNIDWVLYGEGGMIIPGKESVVISNNKVIVGNNSGNKAGRDIKIGVEDSSLKEEIASLRAEIEEKEKQLQSQRELINMLIEKLSDRNG